MLRKRCQRHPDWEMAELPLSGEGVTVCLSRSFSVSAQGCDLPVGHAATSVHSQPKPTMEPLIVSRTLYYQVTHVHCWERGPSGVMSRMRTLTFPRMLAPRRRGRGNGAPGCPCSGATDSVSVHRHQEVLLSWVSKLWLCRARPWNEPVAFVC